MPNYLKKTGVTLLAWLLTLTIANGQGFTNVAPDQGIEHSVSTLVLGPSGTVGTGGSGVCFFDFDNDGWDDITFLQINDSLKFFKNVEGTLQQLPSAIYSPYETTQLLWVDYDNDGDYDAFLVSYNGTCKLYQNNGSFEFTDVTSLAGLDALTFNNRNYSVAFADFDRDGHLDFYLTRYHTDGNPEDPLLLNALYRNNGDGTFSDVTATAGVSDGIQPSFMGVWIDVNNDLWPDLYVANDRSLWGNSLYLNNGDGTFTDITEQSETEMFGEDPMCAAFADYDNDGDLDILCSNGGPPTKPPRLFTNLGNNTFIEEGQDRGINVLETFMCSWGASFVDADNDGFLDLYVTTGLLLLDLNNEARGYLFMSNEGENFIDSPAMFADNHIAASYSVAKGDLNNDGFADLVVQNAKGSNSFIWRNDGAANAAANNWVKITLEGTASNKMAIGAWMHLYTEESVYHHYTRCGDSFVSQDSQHHIFGLGTALGVDSLVIEYPSGHTDTHFNLEVNEHYYFSEGDAIEVAISFTGATSICDGQVVTLDAGEHEAYLWSTGATSQSITVSQPGNYFVQVTNSFGVTVTSEPVQIETTPNPQIESSVTQPLCFGEATGSIALSNSTGIEAAEVTWNTAVTGSTIDNLAAGIYQFEFVDLNGCVASGTVQLLEPDELTVFISLTPVSGENDGGYDLFIFGGTPPYDTFVNGDPAPLSSNNLAAGSYSLEITDANNCLLVETFTIETTVGITTHIDSQPPNIYPNPLRRSEQLNIDLNSVAGVDRILIFDSSGKLCHTINVASGTAAHKVAAADFAYSAGSYRIIFCSENDVRCNAALQIID